MRTLGPTPPALLDVARARSGYVTHAECRAAGIDAHARRRRVEAGLWGAPLVGIVDLEPNLVRTTAEHCLRRVHLAVLAAGESAVAVGLAALVLHGNRGVPSVFAARAARVDHQPRSHRSSVSQHAAFDVVDLAGGVRAASAPWAIVQSLPDVGLLNLVAILDSALNSGAIVTLEAVERLARGRRGCRKLRACLDVVDGRAESFLETWARLQCIDAGIPPDELQLLIPGRGGTVRRGDLAWRLPGGRWLVVEIDGVVVHGQLAAAYADRERQNEIVSGGGVVVLRFTAADLRRRGYVPARIRTALLALSAAA